MSRRTAGVRLIVGCRLDLDDGLSVLVYPTDRAAYGRLCRSCRGQEARRQGEVPASIGPISSPLARLDRGSGARRSGRDLRAEPAALRESFGNRAYMALVLRRRPNDALRLHELSNLAGERARADRRYQ